jgi:hypothetical protein
MSWTKLPDRPPCFDSLEQEYLWMALVENGVLYGYLAYRVDGNQMAVHFEILVPFTRGSLRVLQSHWIKLIDSAKQNGVRCVVAMGDPSDEKWPKFLRYFGFDRPKAIAITAQEI